MLRIKRNNRNVGGVALLTALLITSLAAMAAMAMLEHLSLDIHRSTRILHREQAQWYVQGAEIWAASILARDNPQADHLQEPWAIRLPPTSVNGGSIGGWLEDLQGRFNLNNLVQHNQINPQALAQFQRLLEYLQRSPDISQAVLDWIDDDQMPQIPNGVEDYAYLAAVPAYRGANQPMRTLSELRLLPMISDEDWQILQPHLCTLPAPTPVNLNTATEAVLYSLHPAINASQAKALHDKVQQSGFTDHHQARQYVADLMQSTPSSSAMPNTEQLSEIWSINSDYFSLRAQAEVGDNRLNMITVLHRSGQGVESIYRSFDGW